MRKAKPILIATLAVLQALCVLQFAFAVPMAHGRFNDVSAPSFAVPGGKIIVAATAVNDGDSAGWFRICVVRVDPPLWKYFPGGHWAWKEVAVHCSETQQVAAGEQLTFRSTIFRMLSVPAVTYYVVLAVQQDEPIPVGEEGNVFINLTVDELRVVVVTNLYQS